MKPWGLSRHFANAKFRVGRPAKFCPDNAESHRPPAATPPHPREFPRRDARIRLIEHHFVRYKSYIRGRLGGYPDVSPAGCPGGPSRVYTDMAQNPNVAYTGIDVYLPDIARNLLMFYFKRAFLATNAHKGRELSVYCAEKL